MLSFLTNRKADEAGAFAVYRTIVARARHPELYSRLGVGDTLDGRFEMLILHAALVIRRLRDVGERDLAQRVFDLMFDDLDQSLRESGVGDLSVPRKIKPMAEAFYGRAAAYGKALGNPPDLAALEEALARNVFPDGVAPGEPRKLVHYVVALADALSHASRGDLEGDGVSWPHPAGGPS